MNWRQIVVAASALAAGLCSQPLMAQPKDVKVGLIAPLSGPYARPGTLMQKGAELAISHINDSGGVKSLGGAKLKLITADAGDSTEKAKNAAQRLVAEHPDMVGATGAFVSSFTLAVTEVTERAELPFLTMSFGDQITARGFKYIFQTSATAGTQARSAMSAVTTVAGTSGAAAPKKVAILMDNNAAMVSFANGMKADRGLEKLGLGVVMEEIFTPPLADATSSVQKLRTAKPDLLFLLTTSLSDAKIILERMNEVGLGKGRVPIVASGSHMASPELLRNLGKELVEGMFVVVANWGAKGQESVMSDFKKRSGEPWMPQDSVSTYGDMWVFKEAMEQAGSTDHRKVAAAIRDLKSKEKAAKYYAGNTLQFEDSGRRIGASVVILQWQDGEPRIVYPIESAVAKAKWPRS
jgi:branched-chain amino acid transport system substrate-binding protein